MPDHHRLPPASKSATSADRHRNQTALRLQLLETAVQRWLLDAGWAQSSTSTNAQAVDSAVTRWLRETASERLFEQLPALADHVAALLPPTQAIKKNAFMTAFARSLIEQAMAEVALEAHRAGHASVFAGLRPYLHGDPTPEELIALGATLKLSQSALVIALSRLRRRLRERIEAALALWATSPETRHTLRRQLRQSLIGPEPTS